MKGLVRKDAVAGLVDIVKLIDHLLQFPGISDEPEVVCIRQFRCDLFQETEVLTVNIRTHVYAVFRHYIVEEGPRANFLDDIVRTCIL